MPFTTNQELTGRNEGVLCVDLGSFGLDPRDPRAVVFSFSATLTSAAATTAVDVITAAQVGEGRKVVLLDWSLRVNGATAWTGVGTVVKVQDTAGTPVVGVTVAKAELTNAAVLKPWTSNVTLGTTYDYRTGFTVSEGVQFVADGAFAGGGSDLILTGLALIVPV